MLRHVFILFIALTLACNAQARDEKYLYDIALAVQNDGGAEPEDDKVQFYFGNQSHPQVAEVIREHVGRDSATRIGSSDNEACRTAFMVALRELRDYAIKVGGDAVINVQSYYDNKPFTSEDKYECHAGNVKVGVVLRGTVVKF